MRSYIKRIFHIDHLIVAAFTILIIRLLVVVALNLDFLSPVVRALESFSMTDVYYKIQNSGDNHDISNAITIVDMTELKHRKEIAKVVHDIKAMNPKLLGIDIIFEGEQPDKNGDEPLAEACLEGDASKTGLAYKLKDYDEKSKRFKNELHSFFVCDANVSEGFVNLIDDPTKSIHKYAVTLPAKDTLAYSFPARVSQIVTGRAVSEERIHNINYKPVTFPIVKYDELTDYRELITGRIVLLGTTEEEKDKYYTPIGQKSGVEILAYSILSMTEDNPVEHAGRWMVILWALIAGYITNLIDYFLTKRFERGRSTFMVFITQSEFYDKIISFVVMALVTWVAFELYVRLNYFVDTVLALTTIVLIEEGRLLYAGLLTVLKRKTKWKLIDKSIYAAELD